jgi:hypothetical protein
MKHEDGLSDRPAQCHAPYIRYMKAAYFAKETRENEWVQTLTLLASHDQDQ